MTMQQSTQQKLDKSDKIGTNELIDVIVTRATERVQHELHEQQFKKAMRVREELLHLLRAWEQMYGLPETRTVRQETRERQEQKHD